MRNDSQPNVSARSVLRLPHSALPPVLSYHRIGGPLELGVTRVARSVFERQMTALAKRGWRTVTLREFAGVGPRPASLVSGPVVLLTFDDGYGSLAEAAYPVLADLGFTAATFVITDYVGRLNTWDVRYTWHRLRHLDWDAIERWKVRGFDFASHTATHRRLTWLKDAELRDELERSRETIVRRLGEEAGLGIAYPFGACDARVVAAAREAGYRVGFHAVRGPANDPLALSRNPVYLWDAGDVPFGLRRDPLARLGQGVARVAQRCAVGTSWMLRLRREP